MSGIFDQVINYAPPSLLKGTVTYKGTWSAATNTPTLINPPDSTTNGHYYVVSAGGTQFSLVFNIGDWIISNGSAWEKVDNTDAVNSVFGRTGAVVGVSTDYSAVGITNTALGASNPSTVAATTITASGTIAATGAVTGSNLSGTNTGNQTITLTGGVTGSGSSSFAATVVTNANLTGDVTSVGNATTLTNAPVIAKVLTGYTSGAGVVAATDSILQAIQKLNGNNATNANLTGVITSVGNATSITSQTGTGTKFVVDTSPVLVTPNIGTPSAGVVTNLSGTASININGTVGATTPAAGSFTTLAASGAVTLSSVSGAETTLNLNQVGLAQWSWRNIATTANLYLSQGGSDHITIAKTTGNTLFNGTVTAANGLAVTGTLSSTTGANFATSSGNVGIGTASPASILHLKKDGSGNGVSTTFEVSGGANTNWRIGCQNNVNNGFEITPSTSAGGSTFTTPIAAFTSTGLAVTGTATATGAVVSSGANLVNAAAKVLISYEGGSASYLQAYGADNSTAGTLSIRTQSANASVSAIPAVFSTTGLAVTGQIAATTTAGQHTFNVTQSITTGYAGINILRAGTGQQAIRFAQATDGNEVGSVTVSTTATAYNTSSDYRLKNTTGPVVDSGTFIDALKPKVGTWKVDGSKFVGFLAHEFAEVSPLSVSGEKDAVDAEGKPVYQSMQAGTSEVIANLVAELQSLRKRLAALESK